MFSSNTETNITATYEDSDGTIDLVAEQQLNNTSAPYYHKVVVTVVSDSGNKYALDGGTQAIAKVIRDGNEISMDFTLGELPTDKDSFVPAKSNKSKEINDLISI